MNSLKKALAAFSVCAFIFASFSCRNSSDDESGDIDYDLDLQSYIFLRHRFAESNAEISAGASEADKIAWSNKHFNDAKDYMIQKVADFKHKVRDLEPAGNFLQPICDEIWTGVHGNDVHGYENGGSGIDPILGTNNLEYRKFLGATSAKFQLADQDMSYDAYKKFEAHYAALAARAYNDSLGSLHDSTQFQLNRERGDINNALQSDPVNAPYMATDYTLVEQNLYDMLEIVSRETGVSVNTLVDAVNLNLMNASMWGARDLGATAGFQLSGTNTMLLRPSISNLNHEKLLHNMGTWRDKYFIDYKEQQANQETTRGL